MNPLARTSIGRDALSTPMRFINNLDKMPGSPCRLFINWPIRLLDFGCGRGSDVKLLSKLRPDSLIQGYDPHFPEFQNEPTGLFQVVTRNYVL